MEEEIEDCVDDYYEETDEEYEFDACHFFDFTRPEIESEIEEAERWFEVSGDYPPSPFIVKLNLEKLLSVEVAPKSSKAKSRNTAQSIHSSSDTDGKDGVSTSKKNAKGKSCLVLQDNAKAKAKEKSDDKLFQPRSSTLMKPTASHLAKQQKVHDDHSGYICSRFQRISTSLGRKSSQSTSGSTDNLATKRQKLDIGYLRKVAQLKHQFSLLHKSTKKVTVPREPELETLLRAQRRGSKNSSASGETEKQECNFKARPLNKKIFQGPSSLQPKKSRPQLPEFQLFRLKTMERAKHHASSKVYPGVTDTDVVQDAKQKTTNFKESRLSTADKHLENPPIEKFTELSLGPNMNTNNAPQTDKHASAKGLKKEARNSFQAEFWRCHAKPNQCGGNMRVHEAKCWSYNMTRSLGIH